jgi:hypothetical protein
MNKRLKAKWIKALRSGEYNQTTCRLVTTEVDGSRSFCCLGVLRELAPSIAPFEGGNGILDPLSCGIPEKIQRALAVHNDTNKSFKWIAADIERRKSL